MSAITICSTKTLRTTSDYCFIAHSNVSDALEVFLLLPISISVFHHSGTSAGWFPLCFADHHLRCALSLTSAMHIQFASLSRYLQIVYPSVYNKIKPYPWISIMAAFSWIWPSIIQIIIYLKVDFDLVFNSIEMKCTYSSHSRAFATTFSMVVAHIPVILITFYFYIHILIKVCMSRKKITSFRPQDGANRPRISKSELALTKIFFAVFLLYVFNSILPGTMKMVLPAGRELALITSMMFRSMPVAHFLVFVVMNKRLRGNMKNTFLYCTKKVSANPQASLPTSHTT